MKLETWTNEDSMSMEAVRTLYQPEGHFTVRTASYPAGAKFEGTFLTGADVYVCSGTMRYSQGGQISTAKAGDVLKIAQGSYEAEVLSEERADLILVHELPSALWPK